jgi:hypothetical protein
MKLAALVAVAALTGSTSHTAAPGRDAFVLLGDGRIAKLDVADGRVVARHSLGRTPRVLPDDGSMLAVESADTSAGASVIALSRSTGRLLHRRRFSAYVVAVGA